MGDLDFPLKRRLLVDAMVFAMLSESLHSGKSRQHISALS